MNSFNRRQHEREDTLNFVDLVVPGDNGEVRYQGMARTLNASENGLSLETAVRIPEGVSLNLTLGLKNELVVVQAKVIHQEPLPGGDYRIGVELLALDEKNRSVFKSYLDAFRSLHPV